MIICSPVACWFPPFPPPRRLILNPYRGLKKQAAPHIHFLLLPYTATNNSPHTPSRHAPVRQRKKNVCAGERFLFAPCANLNKSRVLWRIRFSHPYVKTTNALALANVFHPGSQNKRHPTPRPKTQPTGQDPPRSRRPLFKILGRPGGQDQLSDFKKKN